MANDKNSQNQQNQHGDESVQKDTQSGQSGQRREIGEGMHSLDSTQAPLKSENAEPDWDAMTDKGQNRKQ
jgi:hypothetical protein